MKLLRRCYRLERSPRMRTVGCSNPIRERPLTVKQVVTAPMLHVNVRQQVRLSRILGDDHYKRISCVTVGVAF